MPLRRAKKSPRRASLPLSPSEVGDSLLDSSPTQPRLDLQQRLRATTVSKHPRAYSPPPRLIVTAENNDHDINSQLFDPPEDHHFTKAMSDAEKVDVQETREAGRHRDSSIVQRVAERLNSPNGETKHGKSRRSRRLSTSSALSQRNSIAAALAKSGLQIASPGEDALPRSASGVRAVSSGRSPYLLNPHDYDSDEGYDSENESAEGSDNEGIDGLPVTGFAVASNRRNAEFHTLFPTVDDGDYLIEDYGCALAKDILVHGRLYVSENHICFHSNLFGWITNVVIPFSEVQVIEKKMTALVIPNAIGIVTTKPEKFTFASLISRDSTFDVLQNVWRIAHPGAVMMTASAVNGASRPPSVQESDGPKTATTRKRTECACGKAGTHYAETALDTVFPSSPEKVYNLMFNSGWYRTFLSDNQLLRDIESSEWRPEGDKMLTRSTSYVKPLNGSIGPKQTKCHIVDSQEHCDYDDYITTVTTTRTPDVPSGGVFSVKTRTCVTWAGPASTRVLVTTEVAWTGKSWVKGIIDKSAIDGQKQYHNDLARKMRTYIKAHPTEFAVAGAEDTGEEGLEQTDSEGRTAAQEYAAQNRPSKQDEDYWVLQGALDSVLAGFKSIGSGIGTAFNTISDLLADSSINKSTIMAVLLAFLLASNVYTYMARPASQHKAKKLQRIGPSEEDVAEALRIILSRRAAATPQEELSELLRLLDEVEARSGKLRDSLPAAARKVEEKKTQDQLD